LSGIWIVFIGWFLQNAAIQSYRKIVVEDILGDVPVKQMMYTEAECVNDLRQLF
jgi:hypothetical protein